MRRLNGAIDRRRFLTNSITLAAGASVLGLLAACQSATAPAPTQPAATQPTAAAKPPAATTSAPAPTAIAVAPTSVAAAPTAAPAAGAAAKATTLSILGLTGHPSWDATKAMTKLYKQQNPQVDFKLSDFDMLPIGDKVNLDFQAKQGEYDIVWMNSALTFGLWTEKKIVAPLDSMISPAYDLNDYLKLARSIVTAADGKVYGVPIMIEERMLSYREDLFDAAGLKVPTTVDEMTTVAEKLTDASKSQYGFSQRVSAQVESAYDWVGWLYSYGGTLIDKNFHTQLTSPEAKAALDAFLKITKFCAPSSNRGYAEIVKELQTGVAAMANDVTIITPLLEDPKASQFAGKFGYAVAPAGPKAPRPETSAHILSVYSLSKQPEEAWRFLQWMTSKENNKAWVFAGGAAFRESMYTDTEIIAKYPQYTLFKQVLDRGNPDYVPRIRPGIEVLTTLAQEINAAVVGVKNSDQALADADNSIMGILKRDGYLK